MSAKACAWRTAAVATALLLLPLAASAEAASPPIVPAPASWAPAPGTFTLNQGASISAAGATDTAKYLADLMRRTRHLNLSVGDSHGAAITLRRLHDATLGAEGYRLEITPHGVVISAGTDAGLFYGAGSLWQLATADRVQAGPAILPDGVIVDRPRFAWRGLMIDSARHYQSPDEIRRMIDAMALHKLNVLHWHLTDDQGWRLQIKAYPRLTEVAAWRRPVMAAGSVDPTAPEREGGFYTQDEARAIVAYAAARHITVVPEIELPGHAAAAVVAYPDLGAGKAGVEVSSDWGIFNDVYSPEETTFTFLQTVMTEVTQVFPSAFIHIGGDEVVKDEWTASPQVQARMRALGLYDEQALHGYFTSRIGAFLAAHGRRLIGWDEVLQGALPKDAAVMSWRGINGAVLAIHTGHDAVLSPAPTLYFDNRQGDAADEPPGRGHLTTLRDVYDFNPMPAELSPAEQAHVLGVQANLWTEHIRTGARLEYMAFPRAAALAELGWSPASAHDWPDFVHRLQPWAARYKALGIDAASSALEVRARVDVDPWTHKAAVSLSDQVGVGDIRYTTDGSEPSLQSTDYQAPIGAALPARIRAAAFVEGRPLAAATDIQLSEPSVRRRSSQELKACSGRIPLNLEDDAPAAGPRAAFVVDILNPCWIYPDADLSDVTSLQVAVGQLPFNFQIGAARDQVALGKPATPDGELDVRLDTCDGERLALMPLATAAANPAVTVLTAPISPRAGRHDLCLTFARPHLDPMWAVDWVQPTPSPAADAPR